MINQLRILPSILALFLLYSSILPSYSAHTKNKYLPKASLNKAQPANLSSLLASGVIGAITGSGISYLEKRYEIDPSIGMNSLLLLVGWLLESEIRNDIILILQRNLDEYGFTYKKSLMFKIAWLASWIAYLES